MGPNLAYYLQHLNSFVEETEKIGENMHADYEKLRKAIDEGKTTELSEEVLASIHAEFAKGVTAYEALVPQLAQLRPPAKAMGVHKRLEKTFKTYVADCQDMVEAVEGSLDIEKFNASEAAQDKSSEELAFCIQKITRTLQLR